MRAVSRLSLWAGALMFAGQALADPVCPDLKTIQAGGFSVAFGTANHYFTYKLARYNDAKWGFVMGPFAVASRDAALAAAYSILNTMNTDPIYHHACIYDTGNPNLYAVASKEPIATPEQLKESIGALSGSYK